eukprot:GHVN01011882.1.p1 GENE.GHVN01011882.1~~GHVN01011882.1.p1  ORF type:complete len:769 (+),score=170.80 GHVN01011882.1:85-2391(+)
MPAEVDTPARQEEPQQRSWWKFAIQMVAINGLMRWFMGGGSQQQAGIGTTPTNTDTPYPHQEPHNSLTMSNVWHPNTEYDVFLHLSSSVDTSWDELREGKKDAMLVWTLPNQSYNDSNWRTGEVNITFSITPNASLYSHLTRNPFYDEELVTTQLKLSPTSLNSQQDQPPNTTAPLHPPPDSPLSLWPATQASGPSVPLYATPTYYAHLTAVPHTAYRYRDDLNPRESEFLSEVLEDGVSVVNVSKRVIDWIEPFKGSSEVSNLMGPLEDEVIEMTEKRMKDDERLGELKARGLAVPKKMPEPHLNRRIDMRLVYDTSRHNMKTIAANPALKQHLRTHPSLGLYQPVVFATEFWTLEKDYIVLNETLAGLPLNLTASWNTYPPWLFLIQQQLLSSWCPETEAGTPIVGGAAQLAPKQASPLASMQVQTRRELFMFKRMIIDTNIYFLFFSFLFMVLHSIFSFLAFKNDVQFWNRNDTMEGISALSVVTTFFRQLIVGLYIFDSEETSMLLLFEIALSVGHSAWRITKALQVTMVRQFPFINIQDRVSYKQSDTKKYDSQAIKFMSILLSPCALGYCVYSLYHYKYKSWYSFIIASLAGTEYTFGFITMTPQLYINYKLKSVDHLPWRAFCYKALNTFVDDIFAFIIDMPTMHRLACFRDDIIFVCYLYQRWAYRVDKTRPSEWQAPKPVTQTDEVDALVKSLTEGETGESESREGEGETKTADISGKETEITSEVGEVSNEKVSEVSEASDTNEVRKRIKGKVGLDEG